jgi:ABC-type transporter Mla subunit MlaD
LVAFEVENKMMAAAKNTNQPLDLVRLILSLTNQSESVPEALRDHLMTVIEQARQLAADPSAVRGNIPPEALALARQMRNYADLAADFDRITSFESIDSQLASKLLSSLEGRSTASY